MNAWLEALVGLRLLEAWWLGLALPGLLAAWWLRRRFGQPSVRFAPAGFLRSMPAAAVSWRMRLVRLPAVLGALGLLALAFALARPVERVRSPFAREGIDVYLCLDRSSSMRATDLERERTRLQVSQRAASQFVAGRSDDRIGLITFARYHDLVRPLTLDHGALDLFLRRLEPVVIDSPEDRTGIGGALARAADALSTSPARSKLVILLTDGEENVATDETPEEIGPVAAARMCVELGIRVYAIQAGVGRRVPGQGFVPVDTEQVERVARITGGEFFEARSASAVGQIYAYIDTLEKVEFEEPQYELRERFLPFVLVGVALLVLARLLRVSWLEVLP